jgi:tryptophan synthase alpha subunit
MEEMGYPVILVFYLDRELIASDVMVELSNSINDAIVEQEANTMTFFVPTDGEERIEQITYASNKVVDMVSVNKLVNDIKESFTLK